MSVTRNFWNYFWLVKFFLRAAGILTITDSSSLWKSIVTESLAASPPQYGSHVLLQTMNYLLFWSHTVDGFLEVAFVTITILEGKFRPFFTLNNRCEIAHLFGLFSVCGKFWDFATAEDCNEIWTWAKWASFFNTIHFCSGQFATTLFALKATVGQLSSPPDPTIRYYPFRFEKDCTPSPYYEIKYTLRVICNRFSILSVAVADVADTLLASNMCGQLDLIQICLLDIAKGESNAWRDKFDELMEVALEKCIRRHQVVTDLYAEVEEVVRRINLKRILGGMDVSFISGVRLTKNFRSYTDRGTLLLSISSFFISCWLAINLSLAGVEVTHDVCGVTWNHCPLGRKTTLGFMLAPSQQPVKFTAEILMGLPLETFSSIMSNDRLFGVVLNSF